MQRIVPANSNDTNPKLLFSMNIASFILHIINFTALLVLFITNDDFDVELPITKNKVEYDSGNINVKLTELFKVKMPILSIIYFFIASFSHLIILFRWNKWLIQEKNGKNINRWGEYVLSSTVMMIMIAFYSNIFDIYLHLFIILFNMIMISMGYLMENYNDKFIYWGLGCVFGTMEWIVVFVNLFFSEDVDTINVILVVSIFFLFCLFPINSLLHEYKIGPWERYDILEVSFQILSIVTKSTLGWLSYFLLTNFKDTIELE